MTVSKDDYPLRATKDDLARPPDLFGNYLAVKACFSCPHLSMRLPEEADGISLTMSQGKRTYVFPQTKCYRCGGFEHEARRPNKDTPGDYLSTNAEFACNHLLWKLPEEAKDIRLRKRNGLRTFTFPMDCYNCEFKSMDARDKELDVHHRYDKRLDELSRQFKAEHDYIRGRYTNQSLRSDVEADPAYAKRTALLKAYNSLGEEMARRWERHWVPFQERWGAQEGRGYLLRPRSDWF